MAKTLIYAAGSPTSVKIGDTDTDLYLQVAKDNVAVDLTAVKSITVKIADTNKNYLKDIPISSSTLPDGSQGILVIPLNSDNIDGLNSGDYYFEVWIVTADGDSEIYPDMNVTKFHVFNNIVGGTTILTTLTMQAFLDKVTDTQNDSEAALSSAQTELQNANTALNNANMALNDLKNGNYLTKDTLSSAPSFSALQTQVNDSAVGANLLTGTGLTSTVKPNGFFWLNNNAANTNIKMEIDTDSIGDYAFHISGKVTSNGIVGISISNLNLNNVTGNVTTSALVKNSGDSITPYGYWGLEGIRIISTNNNVSNLNTTSYTTIYSTQLATTNKAVIFYFNVSENSNIDLWLKHFKLEKGSVATDWSPNPVEILTQSDYAKIKAAIVALGGSLS